MDQRHECLGGNEAAARIADALSEVISIYPITPASPMAEHCDDWSAAGRPNLGIGLLAGEIEIVMNDEDASHVTHPRSPSSGPGGPGFDKHGRT